MKAQGQILYKDGTTEPIVAWTERECECEVETEFGRYLFQPYVIATPYGMQLGGHRFLKYDFNQQLWYEVDNIKEFQVKEENDND